MKRFVSIRTRLFAGAVVLFLLTTTAVGLVAADQTRDALIDEIERRHAAQAGREAAHVQAVADRLRDQAEAIANEPVVRSTLAGDAPPDAATTLERRLNDTIAFEVALVFDRNGTYLLGVPSRLDATFRNATRAPGFTETFAPAHERAMATGRPELRTGVFEGTWNLVHPVHLQSGTPNGTILFLGPPLAAILARTVDPLGPGLPPAVASSTQADRAYVVTQDGTIQAGPTTRLIGEPLAQPFPAVLVDHGRTGKVTIDGESHLATSFTVQETPWIVVLVTPEAVAFAPVDALLKDIATVAAIAFLVVLIATEYASRRLLAPLDRLQSATREIMHGHVGHQVRVSTRDEFQHLAGAFNHMSATLQQQHARLARTNEDLEQTIEQRTRRLVQMNREVQDLAYAISHDLKTPLVTMAWAVEELRDAVERQSGPAANGDTDAHLRATGSQDTAVHADDPATANTTDNGRGDEPPEHKPANSTDVHEWIDRLDDGIARMEGLISDFLDYERSGKGASRPEVIDLPAFIHELTKEHEGTISHRGAHIETVDLPQSLVLDRNHLHIVLGNLLSNALKYGRDHGGTVRIRAVPTAGLDAADAGIVHEPDAPSGRQPTRPREVERNTPERDDLVWDPSGLAPPVAPERATFWRFEVHDDGPGVADADKERVFAIFVRGRDRLGREQPGTGVGLALVRKLARIYDGDAGVADSPLGGALVWFALPARLVHIATPSRASAPTAHPMPGTSASPGHASEGPA